MKRLFAVILFFLIITNLFSQAEQDSTKLFRVETADGNEYVGIIIEKNVDFIRLKTANIGIISINQKDIVKLVEVKKEQVKEGTIWYENLQATRYFWAPNGYGLQKGEAYYQNMWLMYNQAGYGFSNNFSVGAGLLPLFLFGGAPTPIWITPKLSVPLKKDRVNLGLGVIAATVITVNESDELSFGIAYGVSTFGSRDKNFTLGIGYGYAGKTWAKRPIIMMSGMIRTGKKGYLMTENYIIKSEGGTVVFSMIGGRSLIRRVGLDYGLVLPFFHEMEQFVAIPWLGLTIPIQSK